jgi:hypothetical protein
LILRGLLGTIGFVGALARLEPTNKNPHPEVEER